MHLHPFPEPSAPELEPFLIYSRVEIAALLERICKERTLLTVYAGGAGQFAVSMILRVDSDLDELLLDMPIDGDAQRLVLAAAGLTFVVFFENIKVQFRASMAQAASQDGFPAFRVRLPSEVLRLQRREYFRVQAPVSGQARCLVPVSSGAAQYESLPLINLSVGGLAVMAAPSGFELPLGELVGNCILDLPGIGPIAVHVRVVNAYAAKERGGRRFGCQFFDLAPLARQMIQRYINRVESEQRKAVQARP